MNKMDKRSSSLKELNVLCYDRKGGSGLTVNIPQFDYIEETFGVKLSASDVVLDAGCGVRSHSLSLDCNEKVGLDIQLNNLKQAKTHSRKLHLIRCDVEHLPLRVPHSTQSLS